MCTDMPVTSYIEELSKICARLQLFIPFQFCSNIVCRAVFSFVFVSIDHPVFMVMHVFIFKTWIEF